MGHSCLEGRHGRGAGGVGGSVGRRLSNGDSVVEEHMVLDAMVETEGSVGERGCQGGGGNMVAEANDYFGGGKGQGHGAIGMWLLPGPFTWVGRAQPLLLQL
jgi:hypothetical protein